ncbi:hypothetical protein SAMN04490193_4714 [Pseudomonas marginalis]|uniref:beta-ketoacyl synthase n=1 Tax=Pseudomonas marginalis TaxID=298 RepID=UPI000898BCD2|nr:beta-ketoacyl synthase [Pseudomonas marginalis]SED13944.1 hypothetical protein SAMN04490193_4714 [Pseudomonas marginalis]
MNSLQAKPVYLIAASVFNHAGTECTDLHGPVQAAQPLDFAPDQLAYPVSVPRLPTTVFDRKIQRSVEPQGARLLYCAGQIAGPLKDLQLPGERVALMAAIPEVDGPSSCWEAVQAIAEQPDALLAQLFAYTPPLHALMMLNSSVMAYVAEALHCHGPMGGFCSQSNAGVDALIEAFEHIAEGRADAGVVVSSSPNLSPALYLRDTTERPPLATPDVYGEGAAALLLTACPPANGARALRIAGFARGYSASPERSHAVASKVIQQTLSREKLGLRDVAHIVAAPDTPSLARLLTDTQAILHSCQPMTGNLGASALLTEIALALHDQHDGYTLLLNHSRTGHWGAVLLVNEAMEKQA